MKYKIFLSIIALSIFYSCSEKSKKKTSNDCEITLSQLLKNDSSRLQVNDRAEDGTITQLVDKTNDSVVVGAYYFYPDGKLKSYKFFASAKTYDYNEEYDASGNITSIEGSPLVLKSFRQKNDSIVRFTFFFSTLHNEYNNVNIKTNNGFEFTAELIKNPVFTNIKSTTFDLPVAKTLRNTEIYTSCHLINNCLNKQWSFRDTATFKNSSL